MSWYGVNFVLGAGLHAYGFGTGGQGYVGAYVLAQMVYVGLVWMNVRRRNTVAAGREVVNISEAIDPDRTASATATTAAPVSR